MIENYLRYFASIRRSPETIKNTKYVLERLQKFLGETKIQDASEQQMMDYFDTIKSFSTFNINGAIIICFLQWLLKLEKHQRPANMKWFKYVSKDRMEKDGNPEGIKQFLITADEYEKLQAFSKDKYGQWEALWETYYLSGGRESEVWSMKINDVIIDGNTVTVALPESKTKPREVPLCEYPHRLIRWLGNHPHRKDPEAALWINIQNQRDRLSKNTIMGTFWRYKKKAGIKDTLSVQCFRVTRATIMFNMRSPDGGLIYSDTHMANLFGWEPETVAQRRKEYDISTQDDLKKIIFNTKGTQLETFDTIKREKEQLETEFKKTIDGQQKDIENLRAMVQELMQKEAYEQYKAQLAEEQQTITNWKEIGNPQKP